MNFDDARHARYVGWVLGVARRHGVDAVPVVDDAGNPTDRIAVRVRRDDVTVTVVVPPPPDDWNFTTRDEPGS